jgi:hypothetical protein
MATTGDLSSCKRLIEKPILLKENSSKMSSWVEPLPDAAPIVDKPGARWGDPIAVMAVSLGPDDQPS